MKIGIITYHRAINFGTVLQAFALQKTIQNIQNSNKDCYIIDYKCLKIEEMSHLMHFDKRLLKDILVFPLKYKPTKQKIQKFKQFRTQYLTIDENEDVSLGNIENVYDAFITGSDQVWNYDVCGDDDTYFLSFIQNDKKKYSYAVSFGNQQVFDRDSERILNNLKDYNLVSVREQIGLEELDKCGINYRLDIDPTLLVDKNVWQKIVKENNPYGQYILIYNVQPPTKLMEQAEQLSEKLGLKVIYLTDWIHSRFKYRKFTCLYGQGPEDFINLIYYARYVLTTSFHGTAFSVIFHKDFYSEIDNLYGHNYRIAQLLDSLGLADFYDSEKIGKISVNNDYWDGVDIKLKELRSDSLGYLKNITIR